jgi:hypothetical protein
MAVVIHMAKIISMAVVARLGSEDERRSKVTEIRGA